VDSKLFELRAPATLIVLMATKLGTTDLSESYLLSRSGFGRCNSDYNKYVFVYPIDGGKGYAVTDPYEQNITEIRIVHQYIKKHYDELETGQVLDYDYIVGNTDKPKISERLECNYDCF
jgi:hypothetical protein